MEKIIQTIKIYFGTSEMLFSKSRDRRSVFARRAYMYLIKNYTNTVNSEIAKILNCSVPNISIQLSKLNFEITKYIGVRNEIIEIERIYNEMQN